MTSDEKGHGVVEVPGPIVLTNRTPHPERDDVRRRFDLDNVTAAAWRFSAEVRTERVAGTPGSDCALFCNLEPAGGPVFWDTFLYPDTGSTPWRRLTREVRSRGALSAVEVHVRFRRMGCLRIRDLRLEAIPAWGSDADLAVAIFGDSTDMTCYLPYEYRVDRRLELLLRDRFPEHVLDVHGLAEGGETLERLVKSGRLERELRGLPRCDVVLFRYGLNDAGQNATPRGFEAMLHSACNIVERVFPGAGIVLSTTIPDHCDALDERVRAVAMKRALPCLDMHTFLRRRSEAGDWDWHNDPGHRIGRVRGMPGESPSRFEGDKHPNLHGATMIAEKYFEHLEPLVAKRLETVPDSGHGVGNTLT